ncbi:MAG: leucine-rich repeat protein [Clostridia bacterium]|nr:leucine-rich repeat protein [Clostridia bacterium]
MKTLTIEEKLNIIESSNSLADIPIDAYPPSHRENYYFVSYSHKDYKRVFRDILLLEQMGVNIWYDSEMHIGENWREIAQLYISKFQCAGVIFYLSENSISSPACNQEVEYVLKHNKKFFSINMPLNGCGVQSGYAMLKELMNRGLACGEDTLENFSRAFSDEILYLSIDESIQNKAHQINSICREELFEYEIEKAEYIGQPNKIKVACCKDNSVINIDLSKKVEVDGEIDNISVIADCTFANCMNLESVTLPNTSINVGESAFRNCFSLKDFDFSQVVNIGKSAFRNCKKINDIDLSNAKVVGEDAYRGCTNLSIKKLSGTVCAHAFNDTNIDKINCSGVKIEDRAFSFCDTLTELNIEGDYLGWIGSEAFYWCKSLRKVGPFVAPITKTAGTPQKLGPRAFCLCQSLEDIKFVGEWDISQAIDAFSGCSNIKKIDMDISCTTIPDKFASACRLLGEMTNSSRFEQIGVEAFRDCKSLRDFQLTNVVHVGDRAFFATGLGEVNLPKVEYIGESAFEQNQYLETVLIGENCKKISKRAFFNCANLKLVKILSQDVEYDSSDSIFSSSVKVVYLNSKNTLDAIRDMLDTLSVIYIGNHLVVDELHLTNYVQTDSEENGYLKFVREGAESFEGAYIFDIESDEFNKLDCDRPHFRINNALSLIGQEVLVKHSRLRERQAYFVESVQIGEDEESVLSIKVSAHHGKSFRVDGTLIQSIEIASNRENNRITLPNVDTLIGKTCGILANGEMIYLKVQKVDIFKTGIEFWDMLGNKRVDKIFGIVGDETVAISGLDIENITVFDDKFNTIEVIEKAYKYN